MMSREVGQAQDIFSSKKISYLLFMSSVLLFENVTNWQSVTGSPILANGTAIAII